MGPSDVRVEAGDIDPADVGLTVDRFRAPVHHSWVVPRQRITDRLVRAADSTIVLVTAPAGYGKTTVGLLWDEVDTRPFAWARLESADDEPAHLLRHMAVSLQQLEPLTPQTTRAVTGPGRDAETEMLPALSAELDRRDPLVLVLDDVHTLTSSGAARVLSGLLASTPPGTTICLLGRSAPAAALARHRMSASFVELSTDDLRMDLREAHELLPSDLDDEIVARLLSRTEGWPGGLHLAATLVADQDSPSGAQLLHGVERLAADYLLAEVLDLLPDEKRSLVEESSILDRFCGPLLDDLLERRGAGAALEELDRSGTAFLVALDDDRRWYRYHHLFGDLLRRRLARRHPERTRALHARASELLQRDDLGAAIGHAAAAGETDRAADLILSQASALALGGRASQLATWLGLLDDRFVEQSPAIALSTAWCALARGDETTLYRACAAAERFRSVGPLSDGSPSVAHELAVIRSMIGAEGVPGVLRDTQVALEAGGSDTNPWWALATLIRSSAFDMLGELDEARGHLEAVLRTGSGSPAIDAVALAHLAMLDHHRGDLVAADRSRSLAMDLVDEHNLEGVLPVVSVYAISALIAAMVGDTDDAERSAAIGSRLLAQLGHLSPRSALAGYVYLAQAGVALGQIPQARVWLEEAERAGRADGSAVFLVRQLDALRGRLAEAVQTHSVLVEPLTAAELRVLSYLPTHLSLQEIADALVISRNTVKTHSIAIYRKLGVSSRSEAVELARELGMLSTTSSAVPSRTR